MTNKVRLSPKSNRHEGTVVAASDNRGLKCPAVVGEDVAEPHETEAVRENILGILRGDR